MSSSNEAEYLTSADDGAKFHEIVDESQLETGTEHHYIEIIKDENGKMSSRFVDASAIRGGGGGVGGDGEATVVQADQLVSLDLLNYRVINCDDDDVVQEIITEDGEDSDGRTQYVLQSAAEDAEDVKNVVAVSDLQHEENNSTQYMHIVEKDSVPLVFFSSKPITPEIQQQMEPRKQIESRMKPKKGDFVLSHELLESPKFKLYLYNCKHCDFKCNAIKELTAHRAKEHASNNMNLKYRNVMPMPPPMSLSENSDAHVVFGANMSYCSICSYSSITAHQVRRHIARIHSGLKRADNDTITKYDNIYSKESKSKRDRSFVQPSNSSVVMYYCEGCDMGINNTEDHKCSHKPHNRSAR